MNLPADRLNEISSDVLFADCGIISFLKLKDVSKKQFHSYTWTKERFNKMNRLQSLEENERADVTFYKTYGYLSDGQPFEFTIQDRIDVETGNVVFVGDRDVPRHTYYKFSTNIVLDRFTKYRTRFRSSGIEPESIDIESKSERIYVPAKLTDYSSDNNMTFSVCLNGYKVPDNMIYVFSNGSVTDFFVDTVFVETWFSFDSDNKITEDITFSVDLYDHRDTVDTGTVNGYRTYSTETGILSNQIVFNNVPNKMIPIPNGDVPVNVTTRIFCNGLCLNVTAVEVLGNFDGDGDSLGTSNVTITTDSPLTSVEPMSGKYRYEYMCIDNIKYTYFTRGLTVDEDKNVPSYGPDGIDYSVYINKVETDHYRVNLFVNDSSSELPSYHHDIIKGAVPLAALSIYFNNRKVSVSQITQVSRFSYIFDYYGPDIFSDGNETEFAFMIEDTDDIFIESDGTENFYEDLNLIQYGQDYYLANFLGTARAHQYAHNNSGDDPKNYGGFINRAYEVEKIVFSESEWRINNNPNVMKNILGSRDNISTVDSELKLFDIKSNARLFKDVYNKDALGYTVDTLTKTNLSLMRELLTNFKSHSTLDYFLASSVPDEYHKSLDTSGLTNPYLKVFVNRKLLSSYEYTCVFNQMTHSVDITIPKNVFVIKPEDKPNYQFLNVIEFQLSESVKDKLQILRLFDDNNDPKDQNISYSDGTLNIEKNYFKDFFGEDAETNPSQFILLRRIPSGGNYVYGNDTYGWLAVRDTDGNPIVLSKGNLNFFVNGLDSIIGIDIELSSLYVYDTQFYYHKTITVDRDETFNVFKSAVVTLTEDSLNEDRIKYNADYTDLIGIPIITTNTPELYVNGELWDINTDFEYTTPSDTDTLATSLITINTDIKDNSTFDFYFSEVQSKDLVNNDRCKIRNKHGLIYFEDLKYPFSLDYLELHVNGLKVAPCDITILSDKLIRIGNVLNNGKDEAEYGPIVWSSGFDSVKLRTKFSVGTDYIDTIISNYNISDMEYIVSLLFHNINPNLTEFDDNYPSEDEIDDGYESFTDKVDDFGGVEFGKETPEPAETDSLLTAYLEWLIKSKTTRSHAFSTINGKDMSQIIIRKFVRDYFRIYDELPDSNYDIVANSGKMNLRSSDILVNWKVGIGQSEDVKQGLQLYPAMYKSTTAKITVDHFNKIREKLNLRDMSGFADDTLGEDDKYSRNRFIKSVLVDFSTDDLSNIMYKEDYPINVSIFDGGVIPIASGTDDPSENFFTIGPDYDPQIDTGQINIGIDPDKIIY